MVLTLLALQARGPEFKIPWYQKKKKKLEDHHQQRTVQSEICLLSTQYTWV